MSDHIWPLLRIKAETDEQLVEAYRRVYIETYVRTADGKAIELYDWQDNRIIFRAGTFNHAFSESTDYRFGSGVHDVPLSKNRARRILWIKEVITATKGCIERRHQFRKDSRGRFKKRRILLVVEERYVVVLEDETSRRNWNLLQLFLRTNNICKKFGVRVVL